MPRTATTFTTLDVYHSVLALRTDVAAGPDNIHPEHLRNADASLLPHLTYFFNLSSTTSYLPGNLMNIVISSILKNKKGKITDASNHRPIAKATPNSKCLEKMLLTLLKPYISTADNQFGYKSGLGTDTCVLTLKETIAKYNGRETNVFIAFLDASRAFDRISFYTLFKILKKEEYLVICLNVSITGILIKQ